MKQRLLSALVATTALSVVALMAATALAQPPGGAPGGPGMGMMGGPGGGNPMMLLRYPEVVKALEITSQQEEKLRAAAEQSMGNVREMFQGMREATPEEREKMMEKVRAEMQKRNEALQKKVESILLPHQLEELGKIQIRLQGISALASPLAAQAVGLSATESKKIADIQSAAREEMQTTFQGFRGLRDLPENEREAKIAEMREKVQKMREGTEKKMRGVLSAEQLKTVDELTKEGFQIERRGPGGRGPGQGQGPGGRGAGGRGAGGRGPGGRGPGGGGGN